MPRISAAIAVISSATNGEPPLRRVMLLVKLTPTPVRLIAPTISPAAAQAAAGMRHHGAGLHKGTDVPQPHALAIDADGGGNDDKLEIGGHMVPLQNAGGHCHILQAAIGTAANVDLIEWGALHLLYGVNIINALRAGKIGYQLLCPVVQFPDIVGIRIGMDPGDLLQRQVKVIGGFLASGKKCGFAARLQRHIGNGVPAGHIQRVNGAAHIFQRFIGAAV